MEAACVYPKFFFPAENFPTSQAVSWWKGSSEATSDQKKNDPSWIRGTGGFWARANFPGGKVAIGSQFSRFVPEADRPAISISVTDRRAVRRRSREIFHSVRRRRGPVTLFGPGDLSVRDCGEGRRWLREIFPCLASACGKAGKASTRQLLGPLPPSGDARLISLARPRRTGKANSRNFLIL